MMEITVNIPGLKELAEALLALKKTEAVPVPQQTVSPEPAAQQAAAQAPSGQVQQTPVQTVPVQMSQPQVQAPVPQQAPTVPVQQAPVAPTQTAPVQTSTQSYSLNDLAVAAMVLMDSGRQVELQQLLASFGVDSLPALPPAQYGAFATALRQKGAQI